MREVCIQRHGNYNAGRRLSKWQRFRYNRKDDNKIIFYDYAKRRPFQFVIKKKN